MTGKKLALAGHGRQGNHLRGQSAVEFTLLMPLFMLLFMGVFEFGRLAAAWITLQHSVAEAVRYTITGSDYLSGSQIRENNIIAIARQASMGIVIDNSAGSNQPGYFQVTIRSSRSTANPGDPNDAGGPNDFVRITVQYNHPALQFLFGSRGYVPLTVSQLVINERFARPTGAAGGIGTPQLPPTPKFTNTPLPTSTPKPTNTPKPSATPTP